MDDEYWNWLYEKREDEKLDRYGDWRRDLRKDEKLDRMLDLLIENKRLREDQRRLEWLVKNNITVDGWDCSDAYVYDGNGMALATSHAGWREAIDTAMKERGDVVDRSPG